MKKRFTAALIASVLCLSLSACGGNSATETEAETEASTEAAIANPVEEVTEDEMIEKTGIDLQAPEGAENVTYAVIDTDPMIAQMDYTYDGHDFEERACMTDLLSLTDGVTSDADATAADLEGIDFSTGNISGLCYDFTMSGTQVVSNLEAIDQRSEEGPCYIAWLDAVPGILYNLSCQDALDDQQLVDYAEEVYLPMQGES